MWFAYIAIPFLILFGFIQFERNNDWLGWFLIGNASFGSCLVAYARFRKDYSIVRLSIVVQVYVIALFLVATGGEQKTGILWTYVFPNLIFFLVGFRIGVVLIGIYLLSVIYLFYVHSWVSIYTPAVEARYLATFLAVSLFGGIFEFYRYRATSSLSDLAHELEKLSLLDQLTKTYNRYGFMKAIEKLQPLLARDEITTSALLIDIDFFKAINDQYGHKAGDEVIVEVARRISSACHRDQDIVARWGGEEFLVLLPNTDETGAKKVAGRVAQSLSDTSMVFEQSPVDITVSIGGTSSKTADLDELIKRADKALYKAKNSGRNQYRFIDGINSTDGSDEERSA